MKGQGLRRWASMLALTLALMGQSTRIAAAPPAFTLPPTDWYVDAPPAVQDALPSAADDEPAFSSAPADSRQHWARAYIENALVFSDLTLNAAGEARPDAPMSRGEFAHLLDSWMRRSARLLNTLGFTPANLSPSLDGLTPAYPYYAAARSLLTQGIMDNPLYAAAFMPDDFILRQDAARAVAALLSMCAHSAVDVAYFDGLNVDALLNRYPDGAQTALRARASVAAVLGAEFLTTYLDGALRPDHPLTRAEGCVLVARMGDGLAGLDPVAAPAVSDAFSIRALGATPYGFQLEFTVREDLALLNPVITYAYSRIWNLPLNGDTVRLSGDYLHSVTLRLRELTWLYTGPTHRVYITETPAEFPNNYYIRATLADEPGLKPRWAADAFISRSYAVSGGTQSAGAGASGAAPNSLYPALTDARARNVSVGGHRFDLDFTVLDALAGYYSDIIIAYTTDQTLNVHENNITGLAGLHTRSYRLSGLPTLSYDGVRRVYTVPMEMGTQGTYYVYLMLRNTSGVSRILARTVSVYGWAPTSTASSIQ